MKRIAKPGGPGDTLNEQCSWSMALTVASEDFSQFHMALTVAPEDFSQFHL
jgi:hypothetical protein